MNRAIPEFLRKPATPEQREPLSKAAFTYPTHPTYNLNPEVIHIVQVKNDELKTANCIQWLHLAQYGVPCEGEETIINEAYFALCRKAFISTLADFATAILALAAEAKLTGVFLITLREQEEGDLNFDRGHASFGFEGAFLHGKYDPNFKRWSIGPNTYLTLTIDECCFSFR